MGDRPEGRDPGKLKEKLPAAMKLAGGLWKLYREAKASKPTESEAMPAADRAGRRVIAAKAQRSVTNGFPVKRGQLLTVESYSRSGYSFKELEEVWNPYAQAREKERFFAEDFILIDEATERIATVLNGLREEIDLWILKAYAEVEAYRPRKRPGLFGGPGDAEAMLSEYGPALRGILETRMALLPEPAEVARRLGDAGLDAREALEGLQIQLDFVDEALSDIREKARKAYGELFAAEGASIVGKGKASGRFAREGLKGVALDWSIGSRAVYDQYAARAAMALRAQGDAWRNSLDILVRAGLCPAASKRLLDNPSCPSDSMQKR